MESIFYQFILPILAIVTVLFIVISYKALRITVAQKEHDKDAADRFNYTRQAVDGIGSEIKGLHTKMDQSLLPRLNDMYHQLQTSGRDINSNTLQDILKEIGLEKSMPINEDGSFVFSGIERNDMKVSYLFSLFKSDLVINSFAFEIENPPFDFIVQLLKLNADNIMGTIGLRIVAGKQIIFVDHSIRIPNHRIEIEALDAPVTRILRVQEEIATILKNYEFKYKTLLASEYLELLTSSKSDEPTDKQLTQELATKEG